jgi:hypothetical protein
MRALALALAVAGGPAAGDGVRDALRLGDLICEFGAHGATGLVAELAQAPRASDLLLVYEAVTADTAQVLSSEAPGRRPVLVRATARAVHLIERVGPSVRVTTLTGCEHRRQRGGVRTCVRFAAQHAWHFDERTLADPDRAFAELPSGAAYGRCEPWQVD